MAKEILEDFFYNQMERVYVSSNSGAAYMHQQDKPSNQLNNVGDVFDVLKRKFTQVQSNIEHHYRSVVYNNFGLPNPGPIKRKNSNKNLGGENGQSSSLLTGETIEMAQIGQGDFRERREVGRGHDFLPQQLVNPTWCDKCGDFIWGVLKQCLRCQYCQYTCHHRCRPLVTLDCTTVSAAGEKDVKPNGDGTSEETSLSESTPLYSCSCNNANRTISETVTPTSESSHNDDTDSGYRSGTLPDGPISECNSLQDLDEVSLKKEHLRKMIEFYNEASPSALFSFIGDSNTFQGFIGCTLNLIRPITMSLGARPPSIYEVLTREHIVEQNTMSISFYMPRDTVKHIHVASDVTAKEVIAALLKKFKILDNPRKFAMYSQELKGSKIVKIKRVSDKEFPLQVCLSWGCEDLKTNRLVLQENETGEIEWNAFSLPELQNFMRILDREEDECVAQLQYKYKIMKRIIQQRLKEIRKERKEQAKRS